MKLYVTLGYASRQGRHRSTGTETGHCDNFSTTSLTWNDLCSNPGLYGDRSGANVLSHGTAWVMAWSESWHTLSHATPWVMLRSVSWYGPAHPLLLLLYCIFVFVNNLVLKSACSLYIKFVEYSRRFSHPFPL